uniref:Mediator of RNA polymerase II transcription subunit 22 n=1 Tax=Schistocephalus solidus TaxID=70667 RepID=A0A183SF49_SCHSO
LNSLKSRLRDYLKTITENFELILARAKVTVENSDVIVRLNPYTQAEQDNFEMNVRSCNIVSACENITRLVSEIKQLLILGDFCWLEKVTKMGAEERERRRAELDAVAIKLADELAADLFTLDDKLGTTVNHAALASTSSSSATDDLRPFAPKPEPF